MRFLSYNSLYKIGKEVLYELCMKNNKEIYNVAEKKG